MSHDEGMILVWIPRNDQGPKNDNIKAFGYGNLNTMSSNVRKLRTVCK